jgi:hypothetical protein
MCLGKTMILPISPVYRSIDYLSIKHIWYYLYHICLPLIFFNQSLLVHILQFTEHQTHYTLYTYKLLLYNTQIHIIIHYYYYYYTLLLFILLYIEKLLI